MADETTNASLAYLQREVEDLRRKLTQAEVSRKEARRERDAIKAQLEATAEEAKTARAELDDLLEKAAAEFEATDAEIAEWKAKAEAPPDERITQLEKEIRTRDLKAKFRDIEPLLAGSNP